MYFRNKNDVQPKGRSQKRTCHGFQSNHPTAIKMSIGFSHVEGWCVLLSKVREDGRDSCSSLCECSGKG